MKTFLTFNQMLVRIMVVLVLIPIALIALDSIFMTAAINEVAGEITEYTQDMVFEHVISILVVLFLLAVFQKTIKKLKPERLLILLAAFVFVFGLSVVFTARVIPGADAMSVYSEANRFLQGNYDGFLSGGYLYSFTNQIGLLSYFQIFVMFAGENAYLAMQVVNVLWIMLAYFCLYRITQTVFRKKAVNNITILLMLLCFQILLFAVYAYGIIPAFGLGLLAICLEVQYFKTRKLYYALFSIVAIAISIFWRMNNLIWLIAMALFYVLDAIAIKKFTPILVAVLLIVVNGLAGMGLHAAYASVIGQPINPGIPKTAWVAMGLQESPLAPGWFNGYAPTVYSESGNDVEKTQQVVREDIAKSLGYFVEHPVYAAKFFYQKISSTWNNPTYQSFYATMAYNHQANSARETTFSNSLFYGGGGTFLRGFMNIYQTLIFAGAALFLILRFKRIKREQMLLAAVFLGTFLFHLFWETKAQYVVTAFALLIPYAAYGWVEASGRLRTWYCDRKCKRQESETT